MLYCVIRQTNRIADPKLVEGDYVQNKRIYDAQFSYGRDFPEDTLIINSIQRKRVEVFIATKTIKLRFEII